MPEAEVFSFNLKAVINKQKTRVLFAEVDNDFVDLLFSFLILPMGNIVQVLEKHYGDKTPHVIGSFNTLYTGLADLGSCGRFQSDSDGYVPGILKPKSAYALPHLNKFSFYHKSGCYSTSYYYLGKAYFVVYKVFTKDKASFIICDDLRMVPNAKGYIVQTLDHVGVDMVDMDGSETRNVTLELNEVMDFLKSLLTSGQPLTDIILGAPVKSELEMSKPGISLHQIQNEATANSKKMILKAMFHKSTNKFLLAQAEEDFVSFLFTILSIPLGMVDLHLGGNTSFNKLGSLYRSIVDLFDHKYMNGGYTKDHLMEPATFSSSHLSTVAANILNVDKSRMYMVTDDLTVIHLNVSSVFFHLDQMKVSSSDIKEAEFHIGLEEARNILKASLTSTRAFTDGLFSDLPKIQQLQKPKQEHD